MRGGLAAVAWWGLALALAGCGTVTWPLGGSRPAPPPKTAAAGPASGTAAPAPAAPPPAPAPRPLSAEEHLTRLSGDLRALEASLANVIAASRRQEEQLRFLEHRLTALEHRGRAAARSGAPAGPAGGPPGTAPATAPTITVPPEELLATGQARYQAGEPDAAILKLYELISAHPFHPLREQAQLLVADILMQQKDFQGARSELENLLAAMPGGPRTPETLLRLGTCQRSLGEESQGRQTWERILREYPTSPAAAEARRLLGEDGRG